MNDYKELIEKLNTTYLGTEQYPVFSGPYYSFKPKIFKEAADAIEQLVKERDVAIEDIPKCCAYCGKQLECEKPCVYDDSKCEEFEWRGVQNGY